MREHRTRTWMILLVGQVIYSFSGVFARQCPLPPVAICFYRMLFSVPLLFVPAMHQLRKLSRGDWILLLAGGCFMAIDFSLWTTAITRTTLVNVNLLANLNVLLIVPLSRVLFQEKAPPFFLYGGALAVIGAVILISGGGMPHAPGNFSGDFLAICSSVSYSIYFLFAYRARKNMDTATVLFGNTVGSLLPLFIFMLGTDGMVIPNSWPEIGSVLGIIFCSQIVGLGTLNHCMNRVPANLLSLFLLTSPAVSAITGWVLFSEQLTVEKMVGILLLGAGIVLAQKR